MYYIIEILDAHPFQDLYTFFYRNAMVNFGPDSPIDLVQKGDNHESSRMFNI